MHITIGDWTLSSGKATLSAYITNFDHDQNIKMSTTRLFWGPSIEAIYEFEHEGHIYGEGFRFYFDTMSLPDHLRHWTELTGQIIEWNSPYEVGVNGSWPALYQQGHGDIERGTIRFLERKGCNYRVTWDGTTGGYGDFSIDVWVSFRGIEIFDSVAEGAEPLEVLARHLEPDDFVQELSAFPNKISTSFKPREV